MSELTHEQAFRLSHEWFVDERDTLLVRGISAGLALQLMVYEHLRPDVNTTGEGRGLRKLLKRRRLEWPVRFWHSRLLGKSTAVEPVRVLALHEVNNRPMRESLNRVSAALSERGCSTAAVVVDRSLAREVRGCGGCHYWTASFGAREARTARAEAAALLARYDRSAERFHARLASLGVDSLAARAQLLAIVRGQLRGVVRETVALEALLQRVQPARVLCASDAHRVGRLWNQLAAGAGIRSFVLQHGAPIWTYAYVPVIADRMLVWGEESRGWFLEQQVPAQKLVVVGNPAFDALRPCPLPDHFRDEPRLFLLPNPIDRALVRRMIEHFCEAAAAGPPGAAIKLHPSERDRAWFLQQVPAALRHRVRVLAAPMAEAGIVPGDIAVVGNSTAGIDALVLGARIVNLALPGMPNSIPYEKYGVGVTVALDALASGVERARELGAPALGEGRARFLKAYLHEPAGGAAARAAEVIMAADQNERRP